MNEAHRGKIGHLPKALQEQVNRRLEKGEKGRTLVAWLNAPLEAGGRKAEMLKWKQGRRSARCAALADAEKSGRRRSAGPTGGE